MPGGTPGPVGPVGASDVTSWVVEMFTTAGSMRFAKSEKSGGVSAASAAGVANKAKAAAIGSAALRIRLTILIPIHWL
jgi:hypothetical protein